MLRFDLSLPIHGSIFNATLKKARAALGSDIFIVLLAYPEQDGFSIYCADDSADPDKLSRELRALGPEMQVAIWTSKKVLHLNEFSDNSFSRELLAVLDASDIILSSFVMEDMGLAYACWAWHRSCMLADDSLVKAELLADQIALAIKVHKNEKSSRERGDKLAALLELSTAIYSSLNYKEVLQKAVKLSLEIMQADGGTIFIIDKDEKMLRPLLTIDDRYAEALNSVKLRLGEGISGRVGESGVGIISNHSESDPRSLQVPGTPLEKESIISAPLTWSSEVIGVITLWSYTGKMFSREDLEILTIFARQTADAIENAKLYESLERAYEELTATQEQLIMAEKLKALGDMAGGVAHDFNNALGTILGRTQLLIKKVADPELKKELEVIERVSLKGRRTVQRLQDFTHVSSRSQYGMVDLNKVIKEAIESTRPAWKDTAQMSGITINMHTEFTPDATIDGSHEELKEAISNVILNSVEALPNGGNIWIKTFKFDDKLALQITDDGAGMDENTKNKLFFPFFSTKGKKGVGMGLAVVYGILFRHQADISVESAAGQGAVFTFKFSFTQSSKLSMASSSQEISQGQLSILLVDDDLNLLDVVGDMLEFLGHKHKKADGGKKALKILEDERFDLVITDLGMPEVGGWDVARYCREKYPDMPVILISGWGAQLDGEEALQKVDAVLPKPFQLDEIKATIARIGGNRNLNETTRIHY